MVGDIVFGILMWGLVLLAMALAAFVVWITAFLISVAVEQVKRLRRPSSEKLENIPKQSKMTAEQEQLFTNGINKGRKLENKRVLEILEEMQVTAMATKTKKGESTAWVIENAKVLIKKENK